MLKTTISWLIFTICFHRYMGSKEGTSSPFESPFNDGPSTTKAFRSSDFLLIPPNIVADHNDCSSSDKAGPSKQSGNPQDSAASFVESSGSPVILAGSGCVNIFEDETNKHVSKSTVQVVKNTEFVVMEDGTLQAEVHSEEERVGILDLEVGLTSEMEIVTESNENEIQENENTEFVVMEDGTLQAEAHSEEERVEILDLEVGLTSEIEIVTEADENEIQGDENTKFVVMDDCTLQAEVHSEEERVEILDLEVGLTSEMEIVTESNENEIQENENTEFVVMDDCTLQAEVHSEEERVEILDLEVGLTSEMEIVTESNENEIQENENTEFVVMDDCTLQAEVHSEEERVEILDLEVGLTSEMEIVTESNENEIQENENTEFVVMEDGTLQAEAHSEEERVEILDLEVGLTSEIEIVTEADENEIQTELTKSGEKRKRKKFVYSPRKRAEIKKMKLKKTHCIKETCNCKFNCCTVISEEERVKINQEYWSMTQSAQKSFILGSIKKEAVKRRTKVAGDFRRNESVQYFFNNCDGFSKRVCKVFFITTLGYAKSNDRIIQNMCREDGLLPKTDGRKGKTPANKIDRTPIVNHIRSFGLKISHYRREHAPNRLYLPSDLTIAKMYEDFKRNHHHQGVSCSYELYRAEIEKMNISFVKLGHEECESCEHFELHPHNKDNINDDCETCTFWKAHKQKANLAREMYTFDKEKEKDENEIIHSMDMQKVIMLPRLEMFKNVIFSLRLSVYNLTFAPVGAKDKSCIVPVLWHEAISGRKQEDIISAIYKFLVSSEARDAKTITLWADNCSSQNKNWAFFSFLIYVINSSKISAREIIIKYFEPGHTFMSADSFHHSVERSMKVNKGSKVYDFNDFKEATAEASKKVKIQEMLVEDFAKWRSYKSAKKLSVPERPYLQDIVSVKVERESFLLFYKKKLDDNEWKQLDFLLLKIIKANKVPAPEKCSFPRGISTMRKGSIINLVKGRSSIIPENRVEFWQSLPLSQNDGREDGSDTAEDETCS